MTETEHFPKNGKSASVMDLARVTAPRKDAKQVDAFAAGTTVTGGPVDVAGADFIEVVGTPKIRGVIDGLEEVGDCCSKHSKRTRMVDECVIDIGVDARHWIDLSER